MNRTLTLLSLLACFHLNLLGKAFHVYSPSSKENTHWIVKAIPQAEGLNLEVAEKVKFDFSGRVITAHPSKPLLYVTATGGDPGKVPGAVVFLNEDGSYQKHRKINNDGACFTGQGKQTPPRGQLREWTANVYALKRRHSRKSGDYHR